MKSKTIKFTVCGTLICLVIVGGFFLVRAVNAKPATDTTDNSAGPYKFIAPDILEADDAALQTAGITTKTVETRDQPMTLTLTGRTGLDMENVTHVHAQFGGKVKEVKPALGQTVQGPESTTQPTVLCVIESNDLAQAKAGFIQAKVQLKIDQDNLDRTIELVNQKVLAPKFRVDAQSAVDKDAAALEGARQSLLVFGMAQSEIDQVEKEQGRQRMDYVITSPRSGVVAEKGVSGGEIADPTINFFTIADTAKMWVWGDVYERDLKRIAKGEHAKMILTSDPEHPRDFTIDWISPELDPNTHAIKVRGTIDNKDGSVLADMYGTILVTVDAGKDSLVVPADAVVRFENAAFVFTQTSAANGKTLFRKTPITVEPVDVGFGSTGSTVSSSGGGSNARDSGAAPTSMVRVSSGLKSGQVVVDHGGLGLFNEMTQDAQ